MKMLKNFYYCIFLTLYRADPFHHGRGYNEWKAWVGVSFLQIFALFMVGWWIQIFSGSWASFRAPPLVVMLACLGIGVVNYHALIRANKWEAYARQFARYSHRGKIIRTVTAALFMVFVMLFMWYTLYRLSFVPRVATR